MRTVVDAFHMLSHQAMMLSIRLTFPELQARTHGPPELISHSLRAPLLKHVH